MAKQTDQSTATDPEPSTILPSPVTYSETGIITEGWAVIGGDVGDEAERATRETENSLELRTRDRYRKLIRKIDKALTRIDDGEYGYCEETGEEIGLARLEARPIATLCLDAQERWELRQKQMGDSR